MSDRLRCKVCGQFMSDDAPPLYDHPPAGCFDMEPPEPELWCAKCWRRIKVKGRRWTKKKSSKRN